MLFRVNRCEFSKNDLLEMIERFVVLMYGRTGPLTCVNESRRILCTRKQRAVEGDSSKKRQSGSAHEDSNVENIVSKTTILFHNYF